MNKFKGILLCTDLDGTLLKNDKTISAENLEAIEYFKSEGGFFTFVTGRMPFFVGDIYNAVKPNAPFGCVNGGGLFDGETQKYLWTAKMDKSVNKLISAIDDAFENVGIQVNTYFKTHYCKDCSAMENFRRVAGIKDGFCVFGSAYDSVKEPIAKIIFASDDEDELLGVAELLKSHPAADKFILVRSEKTLFEILPKTSGKGAVFKRLAEYLNIQPQKCFAVGDYDNDISMLKAAGVGIAVSNASVGAKEAADFVTVSNEENALAKVICEIENGKFEI